MAEILIVEDKKNLRKMLKIALESEGFNVQEAGGIAQAKKYLHKFVPEVMVVDIRLPDGNGLDLLDFLKTDISDIIVIVITAYGDIPMAVSAIKKGADDFLPKPFDPDDLIEVIHREINKKWLYRKHRELVEKSDMVEPVGKSKMWENLMELARKVAHVDTTILLIGETGSGKEVLARKIHQLSPRNKAPFIPVNCAAIPKDLVESELFGAEPGAFTGIDKVRVGKFESADQGTIFLDEIGDLSLAAQAKILRILETKEIQRLGSSKIKKIDVRIIAATNKNLELDKNSNQFREDLYFRISVFPITIPPLRERTEDIRLLVEHFLTKIAAKLNLAEIPQIDEMVWPKLIHYPWPGNVRELANVLERAVILSSGSNLTPDKILIPDSTEQSEVSLVEQAKFIKEKEMIIKVLNQTGGNKTKAAKKLGISYRTLLNKIKKYKIN